MRTTFLYLWCCLSVSLAVGQESSLIDRSLFFDNEARSQFTLDADGDHLFYISSERPEVIEFRRTASPYELSYLVSPGRLMDWIPVQGGILVICEDGEGIAALLLKLDNTQQSIQLPSSARGISIEKVIKEGRRVALEMTFDNASLNGIYQFTTDDLQLIKVAEIPPYPEYFIDDNFEPVAAYTLNDSGGNTFSVFNKTKRSWLPFMEHPWSMDMISMQFSRIIGVKGNGELVYYTSNENRDKTALFQYNVKTGEHTELAASEKVDLIPVGFSEDENGEVQSVVGLFARTIRICLNEKVEEDFSFLEENLEGEVSFIQSVRKDSIWLIRELNGLHNRIFLFDRNKRKLTFLCSDRPVFDGVALAGRKAHHVQTPDGLTLPFHVYLPAGSDKDNNGIPDRPLPAVFYVHGGPWVGVSHWNSNFHCRNFELIANRGYAVINVEFRGSTGLGKEFVEKSRKAWGTTMLDDKERILQYIWEKGIADKKRTAIWGWSYGGYAAMSLLSLRPGLFTCGIAMYGISDLEAFGKIDFANNDFWKEWVGDAFDPIEAEMLRKYSAISNIEGLEAPLLLTTGSLDVRVPQSQMDVIADKLFLLEKKPIYFYYPGEVHDYRDPRSWISFWAITEHFLMKHIGGKAQPVADDLQGVDYKCVYGEGFIQSITSG